MRPAGTVVPLVTLLLLGAAAAWLPRGSPSAPGTPALERVRAGYLVELDHAPIHRHAFKTPSLRNVAMTAPYMHNGVYRTLGQVVDFYDRGGGAGIGIALPNQTLSTAKLQLTAREKRELVAFMRALTDTSLVARHQSH